MIFAINNNRFPSFMAYPGWGRDEPDARPFFYGCGGGGDGLVESGYNGEAVSYGIVASRFIRGVVV